MCSSKHDNEENIQHYDKSDCPKCPMAGRKSDDHDAKVTANASSGDISSP